MMHASLSTNHSCSVATCSRCGGLFSNHHLTTDLLLSLLVKQFLKPVNIWRSYRQEVTNRPYAKAFCCNIFSSASQQMRTVILWQF